MLRLPALALCVVAFSPVAFAQDLGAPVATTVEQVIENHRRALMGRAAEGGSGRCGPASAPDEIVVCARNDAQHRIGPIDPEPGEVQRLVAGEVPSGAGALGAGGCLTRCPNGGLDVIEVVNAVRRGIQLLLDPDS
jgi:hypothetical protein